MHPTDDSVLLRQYVETRSDEAFAALVSRHLNLVYSVAVRCVGDPHQAEEIAQSVFILLANKAATLRCDKALSCWLFQTTRLTASNNRRSMSKNLLAFSVGVAIASVAFIGCVSVHRVTIKDAPRRSVAFGIV